MKNNNNIHTNHDHHDHEHHMNHNHNNHSHHDKHHHDHGNHDHDHHHHHGDFKKIFLISLPIGLIIMWLSPLMGINIPFPLHYAFEYSDVIALILSTILLIYGGKPFFSGAIDEFKQKKPSMMALVSLGLAVAYLYSLFAIIMRYQTSIVYMDFLFEFASLILIMLLGHWIEMVALTKAGDARKSLAELLPKEANLIKDGQIIQIPISELSVGDKVLVQAGENIPADGIIIKGESRINESLLTGESVPVSKKIDDIVIGGSTNEFNSLEIEITKTGSESFLSQVDTLIMNAQNKPSRAEDLAKKVASYLFYIALFASIISFITWFLISDINEAIMFAVTTLVIACPHALGLAIPLVISRSTSIGSKKGILIKNREVYRLMTEAEVILLDKTGTLTKGEFNVQSIDIIDKSFDENLIIGLISGIELGSSHPIAESIINFANQKEIKPLPFENIKVISGVGLEGYYNNSHYQLISEKTLKKSLTINNELGHTISILIKDDEVIAVVKLGDKLRESSYHLINKLKTRGIRPIIVSGDNYQATKLIADQLSIEFFANQSPSDKYNIIQDLQDQGLKVIMLGDGINDAPSLALADVGVAIGAGTQVAHDTADIILTNSEPGEIDDLIELSVQTNKKMRENLLWGAGYNFIAIPLAAGLLVPFGIVITPALGAILMSVSTIVVALNAMRLKLRKNREVK